MATLTSVSVGRRWWTLAALVTCTIAVGLDLTVLNVALPTLAGALGATMAQLQWFVAAYSLVLAAALLPGGMLGDRAGRKRTMIGALAVFGAGSLACALATTPAAFIAARAVAGLGAAAVIPVSMSIVAVTFDGDERTRAVGIWTAGNFLSLPLGPILGGWLLTHYWWGWVFLLNLPVVVLAVLAIGLLLPESRGAAAPGLDWLGIAVSSAGLAMLVYGLIEAGQDGWGRAATLTPLAGGVVLLVAFTGWQHHLARRSPELPLVDLRLFGSPRFTWGTVLAGLATVGLVGALFAVPQYLQVVRGTDSMGSGLRLLPMILGLTAGAALAERLARRAGTATTVAAGFGLLAAGMLLGATTSTASGDRLLAGWMALAGLGTGLALAVTAAAALGELPSGHAGAGAGVMQAVQKLWTPLAVALLGGVLNATYRGQLDPVALPEPAAAAIRASAYAGVEMATRTGSTALLADVQDALVRGLDAALLAAAAVAVASGLLALLTLRGRG